MYTRDHHSQLQSWIFPCRPRGFSYLLGGKAHPPINVADGPFDSNQAGAYSQYGLSLCAAAARCVVDRLSPTMNDGFTVHMV